MRASFIRLMLSARALFIATLAGAMFVSPAPAAGSFETPAQTYQKQAADLGASAEQHIDEAKAHKGGTGSAKKQNEAIVKHCETIAKNLLAAAAESDALAQTYDALAHEAHNK